MEEIEFYGHSEILAMHKSTLEITTHDNLTKNGDCIIGIRANKACKNLNSKIKNEIKKDNNEFIIEIIVEKMKFTTKIKGNSKLTLEHKKDIVLRKSAFTCSRTIGINSEKAAIDMPRKMIYKLQDPKVKGYLKIII